MHAQGPSAFPGHVRLMLVLAVAWCCAASWLYMTGLNRDYNVYSMGDPVVPELTPEQIARLPTLQHFEELGDAAESNTLLPWEGTWAYLTQALLPDLYDRQKTPSACRETLVRNYANSPLWFRATCKTSFSLAGFCTFVLLPLALLLGLFSASLWVIRGFRSNS